MDLEGPLSVEIHEENAERFPIVAHGVVADPSVFDIGMVAVGKLKEEILEIVVVHIGEWQLYTLGCEPNPFQVLRQRAHRDVAFVFEKPIDCLAVVGIDFSVVGEVLK